MSLSDYVDEMITAEHLSAFSVVEHFCEQCGDLTPHHLEESQNQSAINTSNTIFILPLSTHECVICREKEENTFDELGS